MTESLEDVELTQVCKENASDSADSPDSQNEEDGQRLFVKSAPSRPSGTKDKYLSCPPENWTRQSQCPVYPWDCFFHVIGKLFGGRFRREPEDMLDSGDASPCCQLSPNTQRILRERVFHDLDPSDIVDYHVHVVGHGDSGSNCFIHSNLKTWWRPFNRIKAAVFMAASQVPDENGGDVQYMSRLVRLVKHFVPSCVLKGHSTEEKDHKELYKHGKLCLLAFDAFYDKDGRENRQKTTLYVPNDYSLSLAREFPQYFYSVGSVNPYRKDALSELERCASNGVSIIKWLPNSMGIDLRDKECEPFYRKMKDLGLALLVHVGEEHTVDAAFLDNKLGNPLFLRRPLTFGVKVIAAHCATEGYAIDYEDPERQSRPCYELFMRLMREKAFEGMLFGDISAVCGFKRVEYLSQLMEATDIHDRLVYGSDYPVPAINLVVHTSKLQTAGLITAEEKEALNELYNFNPLLFDVASKRLLKSSNGKGLPTSLFKEHPLIPPKRKTPLNTESDESHLRKAIEESYASTEYEDTQHSPVEGIQQVLVEVEVHDQSSSSVQSHDQSPKASSVRAISQRVNEASGQEEGEIESEESNEEAKLLSNT